MTVDELFGLIDPLLRSAAATAQPGEEFRVPPLDVLRYYHRPVRWNFVPFFGRGLSIVAVAHQPIDLAVSAAGIAESLRRLARAASSRFPPWNGPVIGLTAIFLTDRPITSQDESLLARAHEVSLRKFRVVPFGLFRINLDQEVIAWSLQSAPDQLFPEPVRLADLLGEHFRRFVPAIEM